MIFSIVAVGLAFLLLLMLLTLAAKLISISYEEPEGSGIDMTTDLHLDAESRFKLKAVITLMESAEAELLRLEAKNPALRPMLTLTMKTVSEGNRIVWETRRDRDNETEKKESVHKPS